MKNNVYIERIECSGCGPVKSLSFAPAPLTVIYGRNEAGKTSIVENLVRVLFRTSRSENRKNRGITEGIMKVSVGGLGDAPVIFSGTRRSGSLDESLASAGKEYPPELFRLLYVRASDTALSESSGGAEGKDLQGVLSEQRLVRELLNKLPGETGYTFIENGHLMTNKKIGAWKTVEEKKAYITELSAVAEAFSSVVSDTELRRLEEILDQLKKEKKELEQARCHLAWKLNSELQEVISDPLLQRKNELKELEQLISEMNLKKSEARRYKENNVKKFYTDEDLHWLYAAEEMYRQQQSRGGKIAQRVLMLMASLSAVALPVVYSFYRPILLPVIALSSLVVLLLILAFAFGLSEKGISEKDSGELKNDFSRRFGAQLRSPADFNSWQRKVEREIGESKAVEKIFENMLRDIEILNERIAARLRTLGIAEGNAEKSAVGLREKMLHLEKKFLKIKERLKAIQVPSGEYDPEPAKAEYSPSLYSRVQKEIEETREKIETGNRQLQQLRQRLSDFIGSEAAFSPDTGIIMDTLKEEESRVRDEIRTAMAGMIGGLAVKKTLENIQSKEKQFLEDTLNEKNLQVLLEKITGHYNRFSLDEESISVGDYNSEYCLDDLSSGSKEQVLMVLRAGMALKATGADGLFMILDDAFQFSDWERRRRLVDMTISMVMEGWQILYFTMDDDLRNRFVEASASLGNRAFSLVELPEEMVINT